MGVTNNLPSVNDLALELFKIRARREAMGTPDLASPYYIGKIFAAAKEFRRQMELEEEKDQ